MIKAIFYDLDWCISDTRTSGPDFLEPIFVPITEAGLSDETMACARKAMRGYTVQQTGEKCDLPKEVSDGMYEAYRNLIVPDTFKTYGDEHCIEEILVDNFLVTSGFYNVQQQKIAKLNIEHMFKEIVIDSPDGPVPTAGKESIFKDLLLKHELNEDEVLVVGDKWHAELTAGKNLGMKVVQTVRPTIVKWDEADFHVESICEIKDIVNSFS